MYRQTGLGKILSFAGRPPLVFKAYTHGLSGPIVKFNLAAPCTSQSFCEMTNVHLKANICSFIRTAFVTVQTADVVFCTSNTSSISQEINLLTCHYLN